MSEIIIDSGPRVLGRSGIHVGPIAWGVMRLEPDLRAARELFEVALESGYTLFDTADIYGRRIGGFGFVEDVMGQVFAESPGLRERIVLATKGGITPPVPYNSSAAYLESAIDASLKRLRTERVDLWQIHRPDVLTHPAEIAKVVEKAHAQGKFQAFGVSNYTPAQVAALRAHLPHDVPLSTSQPEFSPLHLGPLVDGTFDDALTHSAAILAWSPLAGGRLFAPANEREQNVAAALDGLAEAQGASRATVAYSWLMAHPVGVIPIIGTQNADRIREAADALKVVWTREDWYKILTASRGEKLP